MVTLYKPKLTTHGGNVRNYCIAISQTVQPRSAFQGAEGGKDNERMEETTREQHCYH